MLTAKRLLLGAGTAVPLTSKAFDTLVVLIENRDRVVTKDELLTAVWPDVEVEEGNLTQQIFLLRKALAESAQQPCYIVTVPGHGYRFTAPVKEMAADRATTDVAMEAAAPPSRARSRDATFIRTGLAVFGVVAVLVIAIGWSWLARDSSGPLLKVDKITQNGNATNSAMSRDGRYVAMSNDGDRTACGCNRSPWEDASRSTPAARAGASEPQSDGSMPTARATPRARGSKFMLTRPDPRP